MPWRQTSSKSLGFRLYILGLRLGFGARGLKFRFLLSGFSQGSYVVLSRGLEYKYISMLPKNDPRTSCRVKVSGVWMLRFLGLWVCGRRPWVGFRDDVSNGQYPRIRHEEEEWREM